MARRGAWTLGLAALLALATTITYWPVHTHQFLSIDDRIYVTENAHVKAGLTAAGARWAFGSLEEANYWHPLTWLSHMLDVELYGLNPAGHHVTSLFLHVVNAVALFWVLCAWCAMTGLAKRGPGSLAAMFPAFLAAGLFALHPLHVEAVAWISERKELLCTTFWILAFGCYGRYAGAGGGGVRSSGGDDRVAEQAGAGPRPLAAAHRLRWYVLTFLCFLLGLMAKPMMVTLPFVLLLLDYWPLGRLTRGDDTLRGRVEVAALWRCVIEKVPFLALTVVASVSAFRSQGEGDMLTSLDTLALGWRVANAATAYAGYLVQALWPAGLTVYYPHPMESLPLWKPACAGVVLAAITALVLGQRRARPHLLVGWFWYLGTLVPVIGLVQIGSFARADRYTYLSLIGIFVMVAWAAFGGRCLPDRGGGGRTSGGGFRISVGLCVLLVLAVLTRRQLGYWASDHTLFTHQLRVTGGDMVGHNGLGLEAMEAGRLEEALGHFEEAARLQPGLADNHVQVGQALARMGRQAEAVTAYEQALRLRPDMGEAHMNLGITLSLQGEATQAMEHLDAAVRLRPDDTDAHSNRAVLLYRMGRKDEALQEMRAAVGLDAMNAVAHNNLGRMLMLAGRAAEAVPELREAVRLDPGYQEAQANLRQALQAVEQGR